MKIRSKFFKFIFGVNLKELFFLFALNLMVHIIIIYKLFVRIIILFIKK